MVIAKEILSDYKEIYEKAIQLVNEESKNDPPTNPFKSHYEARTKLHELQNELEGTLASVQAEGEHVGEDEFTYKVLLAFVYCDLGRIYVFTEETGTGEKLLMDCLSLVEEHTMRAEAIISYVGALNEIGILYANRKDHLKAFETLSRSERAYLAFKKTGNAALSITDIFGTEVETGKGAAELEKLYTLCTFYLAQVFGHMGELEKSAKYCHLTLKRQLEAKSYEPIDFALNAATLSQYFIGQNLFKIARHHLAVATLTMAEYEEKLATAEMSEQQRSDAKETFKHRYADVARCWAKYGLALLSSSKERLYNDDDEKLAADAKGLTMNAENYNFPGLSVSSYESRISANYCLTFDDAKLVYLFVINWLDQAKEYYTLDTEATEYSKIIKDYAELYQHIAFFEEDPENQAKMQKRRAKYYEELLEALNPVFYLNICRECWYGAGLAYCAILDIKLDDLNATNSPPPQLLQKINQICMKAIKHYQDFIKTYVERDTVTWKPNLDVEEQRTVLYAFFHLGRLYFKLISHDPVLQVENLSNSLKYYKVFTDKSQELKEAAEALQAEVGVCREMVNLLPVKIETIKQRFNM